MITMDPVSSALLGAAFGEVFRAITDFVNDMTDASCKELQREFHCMLSKIDEIVLNPSTDSVEDWRGLQEKLRKGVKLVEHCEGIGTFDVFGKYRLLKLQKYIADFMQTQGVADIMFGVQDIQLIVRNHTLRLERVDDLCLEICTGFQNHSRQLELLRDQFAEIVTKMTNSDQNSFILQQSLGATDDNSMPVDQTMNSSYHVPDVSNPIVGFDPCIRDLKSLVFQSDVNVIGVTGMGGSGKTTLVSALCKDAELKNFFNNNVVFITVSQDPNFMVILERMWDKILGGRRPRFQNDEDARYQLQMQLRARASQPILVVLDDVWLRSDLEKLLFNEGERYKTLVTTRNDGTIPNEHSKGIYSLRLLEESDALPLFCFWAFGQPTIPNTEDETLVKQVQAECKRLPLALKVIGRSLRGKLRPFWESAKNKLQRAIPMDEDHKRGLLDRLKTSIDVLDDQSKQCFLDLGAFPEGRKVPADALLRIWVHVRGMEWTDAFVILLELGSRNLLNLTSDPGSQAISYGCGCELFFSQHDVMRDLALHLATSGNIIHWKRLFMPRKENGIPVEWKTLKDHTSVAQIVSIHTGAMEEEQWCQIDFPEVEALVLFFDSTEYHLPPFLHSMRRLKVLTIHNYSSKRATLNGLDAFLSPAQIETIQLEKLIIPPLLKYSKSFESLEKLSVSLCAGLKNMTRSDIDRLRLNFSKLKEIMVDHCSDLEELPMKICDLTSLQILSVTNCHLLQKLPEDLGRLSSLRVLRLSACPRLGTLPPSICKLGHLEFLDISLCRCLRELPVGIGQLSSLNKLDMRECSGLRQLPNEVDKLRSLRHVVCDENVEQQWLSVKASAIPELKVEVVEERFGLEWLDD